MNAIDGRLHGKTAVVTGGTRGVGRGIARELAKHGATVYVTGRSTPADSDGADGISLHLCDHRDDAAVARVFARILERGAVDILVNSVWGGYEDMVEQGQFTWGRPFWQQPLSRWDAMFAAGVRAHYVACQLVTPRMVERGHGLIVNLSHWAAQKKIGNVAYGVAKAATDKMTADMASELRPHGVAVVSLYPGLVRTERVMAAAQWLDMTNSESPEFTGRAVVALAADGDALRHSGHAHVVATLAREYDFTDIDGRTPRPLTLDEV